MKKHRARTSDRRQFLAQSLAAAGALAAPAFVRAAQVPTSDRLAMGFIGLGGMGTVHLEWFRNQPDVAVAALCDVDQRHLRAAREKLGDAKCATYTDFRELLARPDIDAVLIATPDHWHALVAVAAARAGKHIYCEKPLTNSIGEGRAVCDAVSENNVVLQTGSHERSNPGAGAAKRLIGEGRFGDIKTVRIQLPTDDGHLNTVANFPGPPPEMEVPEGFDYDFWLGHTPVVPYTEKRCHFWWRFFSAYGGGEITDRGAHVIDLAHMILGLDDTGPVSVRASGEAPTTGFYDAFMKFQFEDVYPNGLRMIGDNTGPRGLWLEGSEGRLFVAVHGAALSAEPASLLEGVTLPPPTHHAAHRRNFVDAVKSGGGVIAPAEAGHRTASVCHLNNIAMRVGRPLEWDPVRERTSDDEANAMLMPTMRSPWSLEV